MGTIGEFTGPEGLREGPVPESTATLAVFAETFPDFTPTLLLQEGMEALREATSAGSTQTKAPKEETMALFAGTFPLFTRPVATRMPSVAIIYPSPI